MTMQITYGQIREAVLKAKNEKTAIMRDWDFYRNQVGREPYFPRPKDETDKHYQDRLKISVAWCGAMVNRTASYFRKAPIEIKFSVKGNDDDPLAKQAEELWAEIAGYNNYEAFMVDVARDAGVGGNAYTKARTAMFDDESGQPLKTLEYDGRVFIDRLSEVFVFRIDFNGTMLFVEAWEKAGSQAQLLSDQPVDGKYERIEVILPASFDPIEGKKKTEASWVIWEKRSDGEPKLIYGPETIPFALPIQRFANLVSRPKSEDGISDIEWAIPLVSMINHTLSGAARAIQYHGEPKTKFTGVDDVADVKWGTDNALYLPADADADFLTWDQNISGAKTLYGDALDIIASISAIPRHMMKDLGNAGVVPSGAALKIMYEGMNQVCSLKEAGFKEAEEQMIKGALSQLAFYNNKAGLFDNLSVDIKYNPDRTPRDVDAEFLADQKKLLTKYLNLVDIVMKYEPSVKTREDAIAYLKLRAEENKQLQALGVINAPVTNVWGDQTGDQGGAPAPEPGPIRKRQDQTPPNDQMNKGAAS
jgi:hypothetical protein